MDEVPFFQIVDRDESVFAFPSIDNSAIDHSLSTEVVRLQKISYRVLKASIGYFWRWGRAQKLLLGL